MSDPLIKITHQEKKFKVHNMVYKTLQNLRHAMAPESSLNPYWPLPLCLLTKLNSLKHPEQVIFSLSFWAVEITEQPKEIRFIPLTRAQVSKRHW